MPDEIHRPGVIPRSRRRLVVWVLIAVGVLTLGGSLIVNAATGSTVDWFWIVAGVVFVVGLMGFYLWIRLSD